MDGSGSIQTSVTVDRFFLWGVDHRLILKQQREFNSFGLTTMEHCNIDRANSNNKDSYPTENSAEDEAVLYAAHVRNRASVPVHVHAHFSTVPTEQPFSSKASQLSPAPVFT